MSEKAILVTGGTGFIGSCLVKHLVKLGRKVRVLARENSPNIKKLEGIEVEWAYGDICLPETLPAALDNVSIVYHCAAIASDWAPYQLFYDVNVEGTKNILEASVAAKVSRFVSINTNDVFGIIEGKIIDESFALTPWKEPYPDTKILSDQLVRKYHKEHGLPTTTLYPCWVFGVGDTSFLPHIVEALIKKEMVFWRKDSLMWPVYIENLLDLLVVVAEDDRAIGNGYLIHDGVSFSFEQFCALLSEKLGLKRAKTYIPKWAAYSAAVFLETIWKALAIKTRPLLTTYVVKNLGSRLQFSIDKADKELGWKPKVSFEQGLATTVEWLKEEFKGEIQA